MISSCLVLVGSAGGKGWGSGGRLTPTTHPQLWDGAGGTFLLASLCGVKGKPALLPPPHPEDLNPGFRRGIKNNEDMGRWFLFISTAEEINVTLIM